jgi:hypothetical protein
MAYTKKLNEASCEKVENVNVYRQTDARKDRLATDMYNGRSEKLTLAFSSGELNTHKSSVD